MSNGMIQNRQQVAFDALTHKKLPEMIQQMSTVMNDVYQITFTPLPMTKERAITVDGTYYIPIKVTCTIKNLVTQEEVSYNVDLLNLPVYRDLGFQIKGSNVQILDLYDRTPGWSFATKRTTGGKFEVTATALATNGSTLKFIYGERLIPLVDFKTNSSRDKSAVSVSTFLRAITGYTQQELLDLFDTRNPFVLSAFSDAARMHPEGTGRESDTRNMCIETLANAMLGTTRSNQLATIPMKLRDIKKYLFSANYMDLGENNANKLAYTESFSYRANNKVLAETVCTPMGDFHSGIILTPKELEILDNLPINSIRVTHNGKQYLLQKFSNVTFRALGLIAAEDVPACDITAGQELTATDLTALNASKLSCIKVKERSTNIVTDLHRAKPTNAMTQDDILTAVSIWFNNLNGFDTLANQYELTNRMVVPFDAKVMTIAREHMNAILRALNDTLSVADSTQSLVQSVPDFSNVVNPDAFISYVRSKDNKTSQMSDVCNLVAHMARDNKVTSNMKTDSITPDLVNIQNLQEGRLDAFDVPESTKIGIVHNRTMLSELSDSGELQAPYLVVHDGKVVSDKPVYLSATEESDTYIAEWNETFENADGSPKKTIRASYNGNIVNVETGLVTYKQYSSLQTLSLSHALITFPGHSNGKRITMACNQVRQAVPFVNRVRPYSNACGESLMDAGFYYTKDVTNEFYESSAAVYPEIQQYKDIILDSDLKLNCISSSHNLRTLTFDIIAVKKLVEEGKIKIGYSAVLSYPYLVKTAECGIFSYDINHKSDGLYHKKDVIAYSNSMSLEDKQHVMYKDFGAQDIQDSTFNKGLALAQNLNVFWKTCSSSTIDDACVISRKLVGDDTLTSISVFSVTATLRQFENKREEFGHAPGSSYDYFDFNGLPKIGTVLYAGDPVICKVVHKANDTSVHYTYLSPYISGQVVYTNITTKNDDIIAEVLVAQRSYIQEGDKLTGRHGNKGVIARIVDEAEMPYIPELGVTADILLSPLGIPSRQNISQLLDAAFGLCMKMDDSLGFVSPYATGDLDFVKEQMTSHDVHPYTAIDGRTGLPFKRPVNYGVLGMYKLHHMAMKKAHAIGMDAPVDPVFLQPRKGAKLEGGQSIGEMELWALAGTGCRNLIQEFYSTQSDDCFSRNELAAHVNNNGERAEVDGNNSNELSMKACYRSMGVEFNSEGDEFTFKPVDDDLVKSLSPRPIGSAADLHSVAIFGSSSSLEARAAGRDRWGWIELNTKMVNPLWVEKGSLHRMMLCRKEPDGIKNFPSALMKEIVKGEAYVYTKIDDLGRFAPYILSKELVKEIESPDRNWVPDYDDFLDHMMTGMKALVWIFEHYDLSCALDFTRECLKEYNDDHAASPARMTSEKYRALIMRIRYIEDFLSSGQKLTDYVTTVFPIMPQSYRPKLENAVKNSVVDFDWHYKQIMIAANNVKTDDNTQTEFKLYARIREFIGITSAKDSDSQNRRTKHQNLLNYFAGKNKNKNHGKIRSAVQSKRVVCSGRAPIVPAKDTEMTPKQIGVPLRMLIKIYEEQLIGYLSAQITFDNGGLGNGVWKRILVKIASSSKKDFNRVYEKYLASDMGLTPAEGRKQLYTWVKEFIEGCPEKGVYSQVVLAGRQPTLHKYSIRAFYPVIVDGNAIRIHPIVCAGYNADFDGDQMYLTAALSIASQEEGMSKLAADCDFINPKDSAVMLSHTQDIVLGCYCATMLENNGIVSTKGIRDAFYYSSIDALNTDVFAGVVEFHDLIVFSHDNGKRYLSTAGRILFNALLTHGFTDKPFSNPLNLAGVNDEKFCDLRYDALITKGKGGRDGIVYINLKKICMELFQENGAACLSDYQNITKFGFHVSDIFAVSLSLQDLDIVENRKQVLEDAFEKNAKLEQDCLYGLVSPEDKKDAVYMLYNDKHNGASKKVKDELFRNLSRDNNIFIMMDSGARGNETQVMHMCGMIGNLQKTKTEDMEDPVVSNYYEGLTSFDVHMASYSTRIGLASTQNETRNAGYSTHEVVFMTSGVEIVEEDCGKEDWWFDVIWGDRITELDKLVASRAWFTNNLLGKQISADDTEAMQVFGAQGTAGVIDEGCFMRMVMNGGFHSVTFSDGTKIEIDIAKLNGCQLSDSDTESMKVLQYLLDDGLITDECIKVIQRHAMKSIDTEWGTFTFRYKMDDSCRSLLLHREGRKLKYLQKRIDRTFSKPISVITEETLNSIEEEGLDRIQARVLLDCKSKHGICAHCFGLKYSNLELPEIHEFVGTESAQAIGEPAAQLTISLVNKGGEAGQSVASGVQIFKGLLDGNVLKNGTTPAKVIPNNGYVRIHKLDKSISVCIEPDNKDCEMCQKCMESHTGMCALQVGGIWDTPQCLIPERLDKDTIIPVNNEWVKSGDQLTVDPLTANSAHTYSMVDPNLITSVDNSTDADVVLRKRQMTWLLNYYKTFVANNIYINARHFEILARVQNNYVMVLDSKDGNFKPGEVVEVNEVINNNLVDYEMYVAKRDEVILRTSGAFTALSFENLPTVAASLVNKSYRGSLLHNNSLLGSVSAGTNLVTNESKVFNQYSEAKRKASTIKRSTVKPAKQAIVLHAVKTTQKTDVSSLVGSKDETVKAFISDEAALLEAFSKVVLSNTQEEQGISASPVVETKQMDLFSPTVKPGSEPSSDFVDSYTEEEVTEEAIQTSGGHTFNPGAIMSLDFADTEEQSEFASDESEVVEDSAQVDDDVAVKMNLF